MVMASEKALERATMCAEIATLISLRERESELRRCLDKGEDARLALKRLKQSRDAYALVQKSRERLAQPLASELEDWWVSGKSISPTFRHLQQSIAHVPDSVQICHAYDMAIPATQIQTAADAARALTFVRKYGRGSKEMRTARCVLPASQYPGVGSLQNLKVDSHARLSVLSRWILNRKPSKSLIMQVASKFDIPVHQARLLASLAITKTALT